MKSRFRLGKQGFGASFGLFFDAGPVLFEPTLDLPFVALDGPARGFLPAPSQGLQKLADVVEMIRYAKLLFAHFCNSFLRPQIARITVRLGAFQKLFEKLLFLGRCESGTHPSLAGFQRLLATLTGSLVPPVDRFRPNSQLASHFDLRNTLPDQRHRSQAPLFQLLGIGKCFHAPCYRQYKA